MSDERLSALESAVLKLVEELRQLRAQVGQLFGAIVRLIDLVTPEARP